MAEANQTQDPMFILDDSGTLHSEWDLHSNSGAVEMDMVSEEDGGVNAAELYVKPFNPKLGFRAKNPVDVSGLKNGKLRFDMKEMSDAPETDTRTGLSSIVGWRLAVSSSGKETEVDLPIDNGVNPKPNGDWQTYDFALDHAFEQLDKTKVETVSFYPFCYSGAPHHFDQTMAARVSNVRFEAAA